VTAAIAPSRARTAFESRRNDAQNPVHSDGRGRNAALPFASRPVARAGDAITSATEKFRGRKRNIDE
jgi:hypothetical protein